MLQAVVEDDRSNWASGKQYIPSPGVNIIIRREKDKVDMLWNCRLTEMQ